MLAGVLILQVLPRRLHSDAVSPFLTHYSGTDRTELSARSFANWVSKTANLVVDEFGMDPGDRIRLAVADDHPGHWMTLVWTMAAWQAGLCVVDTDADLLVAGPEVSGPATGPAVACSLHPLGLGLRDLPSGWTDFSTAALAQPDEWFGAGPDDESDPAWVRDGSLRTFADLAAVDASAARRVIAGVRDPWQAVQSCLLAPLFGGGSTVVVAGETTPEDLERIAEAEKADL